MWARATRRWSIVGLSMKKIFYLAIMAGLLSVYQNSKTKKYQTKTVAAVHFLWLVFQHILPRGFRRARDYGFFHPNSKKLLRILQWVFRLNTQSRIAKIKPRKRMICSCCGAFMNIIKTRIPSYVRVPQLNPT